MSRCIALLLFWVVPAKGQFDSLSSHGMEDLQRLEIEVVPVWVMESFGVSESPSMAIPNALATVHEALAILGVRPNEYNISVSDNIEYLECYRQTVLWEQRCSHFEYGHLYADSQSWADFVTAIPRTVVGSVVFWVILRPDYWPWEGTYGIASRTPDMHEGVAYDHWSRRECNLVSIDTLSVVAHELGHCFRLGHNEDDTDYEIDLMQAYSSDYDWLKNSNKAIVRHTFRYMPPDTEPEMMEAVPSSEIIF